MYDEPQNGSTADGIGRAGAYRPPVPFMSHPDAPDAGNEDDGLLLECPHCSTTLLLGPPTVRRASTSIARRVVTLEPAPPVDAGLRDIVRHVQTRLLERALLEARGVKVQAAELLGIKYSTFWERASRREVDVDGSEPVPAPPLDEADRVKVVVPVTGRDPLVLDLPTASREGVLDSVVDGCRRELSRIALDEAGGNMSRASKWLGLPYSTFRHMLPRLDLRENGSGGSPSAAG